MTEFVSFTCRKCKRHILWTKKSFIVLCPKCHIWNKIDPAESVETITVAEQDNEQVSLFANIK